MNQWYEIMTVPTSDLFLWEILQNVANPALTVYVIQGPPVQNISFLHPREVQMLAGLFYLFHRDRGIGSSHNILYMRILRYFLSTINAWPWNQDHQPKNIRGFCIFLLIQSIICIPPMVLYISDNMGKLDFFQLGHSYITLFMTFVATLRYILPLLKSYLKVTEKFVNEVHLFHHRNKSDYAMEVHLEVHKMSHFSTIYLVFLMILGIALFNITPLFNNFNSGIFSGQNHNSYEHSVYFSIPFVDPERDFNAYIGLFIFNWYISYFCSAAFCIYDLYLFILIFHEWGHLKILKNELLTFPRPATQMFSKDELPLVLSKLKELVEYHRFVMSFSKNMSDAFGFMVFVYYIFHQVSGCLLLLECSQLDTKTLARYGPLTWVLFQQLIQLSVVFELVSSKSESLIEAVYALPWECMDSNCRKVVQILLRQVQRPIRLKAMGLADVGVHTMAAVLRASFSYFAFLRSAS